MPIPAILRQAQLVVISRSVLRGGRSPSSNHLGFSVVTQKPQLNWCWAAVTYSIDKHYDPASPWTKCSIANSALGRTDCCGSGASDPNKCDQTYYLDKALTLTGKFTKRVASPIPFVDVQNEINAGRPVGTRVGWNLGGGHFQAIIGWRLSNSGNPYVTVSDPYYGDTEILFREFAGKYQSGGVWNFSYLTNDGQGGGEADQYFDDDGLVLASLVPDEDLRGG